MANFWKELKRPFSVLAPMEGVTDYVFRNLILEIGKPDVMFTEFTSADALDSEGFEDTIKRLKFSKEEHPIVAQIWSNNPHKIFKAVKLVEELGFDGVDINMGCPVYAVTKKGSGAALIKTPQLAKEIVLSAKEAKGNIALSVKTRIGYNSKITEEWIPFLLNLGIDALTVHGRTAKEQSKVPANWNEIQKAVEIATKLSPSTTIIGNGDVKSLSQVNEVYEKYKVDGVMIGRGIFQNPYLFNNEKNKGSSEELVNLLIKHSEMFINFYGSSRNYAELRRFFKIYINSFRGASQLLNELMKCENHDEVCKVLELNKKLYLQTNA